MCCVFFILFNRCRTQFSRLHVAVLSLCFFLFSASSFLSHIFIPFFILFTSPDKINFKFDSHACILWDYWLLLEIMLKFWPKPINRMFVNAQKTLRYPHEIERCSFEVTVNGAWIRKKWVSPKNMPKKHIPIVQSNKNGCRPEVIPNRVHNISTNIWHTQKVMKSF